LFPFIHITPDLSIPTYYLVISLVAITCLFWIVRRTDNQKLSRTISLDVSLIVMISAFLGARFMHILYEDFEYYKNTPQKIFYFWDGGFVFYGGAIAATLFGILFLKKKTPTLVATYLDLFAPVLSMAYAVGRLACLLAGCCYGRLCDLPWAIQGRHPAPLYASLWELGVVMMLLGIESIPPKQRKIIYFKKNGSLFFMWMIMHGLGRLMMESFRDDFRGPVLAVSISSWISWAVIALGSFLLLRKTAR
jgi:phosphatidylglycerol:prolipoprotein diacylglycerol transferase